MNRLPNYENAFIEIEKLTEYCLNEFHPYGKEKAVAFKSVLGIGVKEAVLLKKAILECVASNECVNGESDEYGERFSIDMKICIFEREAMITTGWIMRNEENFPRLRSCYIKKRNK